MMNKGVALAGGVGLGAGLMYLLDPDRGARRRAIAGDKVVSAMNTAGEAVGTISRDGANRAKGLLAEGAALFRREPEVAPEVLEARVRSALGRVVSHPAAIEVTADGGKVTLAGPVLAHETVDLLDCVASVRGVAEIDDRLEVHKQAGNNPSLQGGKARPGARPEYLQQNWSPAPRVVAGALGGAIAVSGFARGGSAGTALGLVGLGLLARAATNTDLGRFVGAAGGRRGVEIQKTITVAAPVEAVYAFWSNYENFPRFMTNVLEVRATGDGRSHWTVAGPAGVPVSWDAVETKAIPNELLAWKSVEGSVIANAGMVAFEPADDGGTRVTVHMSYNPPAGAIGHGLAALVGADPKSRMDEDLMRMKSFIETGEPPRDAAVPSPNEPAVQQPARQPDAIR